MVMASDCCCPVLPEDDWDFKKHEWSKRAFYRTKHAVILHMPIGIAKAIQKGMDGIKSKSYTYSEPYLMLDDETGAFSADMLMSIDELPHDDPNVVTWGPSTLYSKYYHGEFKGLKQQIDELVAYVTKAEGKAPVKIYTWVVNCPECWKKQGGPTTIIFARVK